MLRHAGTSEIYTRAHPLHSIFAPSSERTCRPLRNLRHASSCLVSFAFYHPPPPLQPLFPLYLTPPFLSPLVPSRRRLSYTVICTFDYGTSEGRRQQWFRRVDESGMNAMGNSDAAHTIAGYRENKGTRTSPREKHERRERVASASSVRSSALAYYARARAT